MKWMTILLLLSPDSVAAESDLAFHLCSAFVQQVFAGEQTDAGWPVFVKLTAAGRSQFASFTTATIGSNSRIVAGGQIFFSATIQAPITSGVLQQTFHSHEVALTWQQTLTDEIQALQCGAD